MNTLNGLKRAPSGTALALGLLLAACIPTLKEEDRAGSGTELGNVVGQIYTADNRPAAGITVTLYPENLDIAPIKTAVTDAEGNYAFRDVSGSYRLFALDGAGNGLLADSIDADPANPVDLELRHLSPLASVSGHAKVADVRGTAKVELHLERSPFRLEVDPNSDFLWTGLPAGRYWLGVSYSWAEGFTLPVTLVSGQTLDLDTLALVNRYSAGISRRDTLKVSSSQLPLHLGDKLANDLGQVDSVFWVLNGEKMPFDRSDRYMNFILDAGSLADTGYNVLEMRLYLKDTAVFRAWYIDLDDSPVIPWARHAAKAVFLAQEEDPRQNTAGRKLGTFHILERRTLSEAEMSFWKWAPVAGGDTAFPDLVKIPMVRFDYGAPLRCGDMAYEMEPELFPGDTVTFLTAPDEFSGGRAMRIRKDEEYGSFAHLAWFAGASWPLAEYFGGGVKFANRDIRIGAGTLRVRLERNYHSGTGGSEDCIPFSRGFTLGGDGTPREYVAMPAGMSSAGLLLHFRAGLPKGLYTEALAASGDYVFLDSSGRGVAGSGTDRREIQLTASEVAELKALLAPLPAAMPLEWDMDYLEDASAVPPTTRYLLSGGRGSLLAAEPRSRPVPEAKLSLFQEVEAWLRSHDLL